MQYPIQVPNPCHEAWNEMTPNGNGRHCDKCAKTVVDFTSWEMGAIQEYLLAQGKNRTCGRFRTEQLTPVLDKDAFVQSVAKAHMPVYKKIAAILLLAFGLIQMSCNTDEPQPTNNRRQLTGVTVLDVHPIDTVKPTEHRITMGLPPLIIDEKDTTQSQTEPSTYDTSEIIKGDVMAPISDPEPDPPAGYTTGVCIPVLPTETDTTRK